MLPATPTQYRQYSRQAGPAILPGAARRRKARRAARQRRLLKGMLLALFCLVVSLSYPVLHAGQNPMADAGYPGPETASGLWRATPSPTPTRLPATPTPSAPPPTALPTPSPTRLPDELLIATAWQATLDQATYASHATQTQVAIRYAATQTALPARLTAMAGERAAIATQSALSPLP